MTYALIVPPEQMEHFCFIGDYTGIPISMLVDDALRAYVPRFLNWIRHDGKRSAAHNAGTHKEVTL
jgi:hypothetical protein